MPPPLRPLQPDERIAVAIPTKNRPTYVAALLASLVEQSFQNWALVINDSSDAPVREQGAVRDLLALITSLGHPVHIIRTETGWDRYQRVMEVVPPEIELIVRIDDDVLLTPRFLADLQRPFRLFADRPVAAVGGCVAEPHRKPLDLDVALTDKSWVPTVDQPTWRLQGYHYTTREVLEVESLVGHSICYRRSALQAVGGWAVKGYSDHAHGEETDACMRLRAAGYELLVTTEALAWHLVAPDGGSRSVEKTDHGVFLISDRAEVRMDIVVFRVRLEKLKQQGLSDRERKRYRIADLNIGRTQGFPMIGWPGRLKAFARAGRRRLAKVRRALLRTPA